jgi:hypothetical protein
MPSDNFFGLDRQFGRNPDVSITKSCCSENMTQKARNVRVFQSPGRKAFDRGHVIIFCDKSDMQPYAQYFLMCLVAALHLRRTLETEICHCVSDAPATKRRSKSTVTLPAFQRGLGGHTRLFLILCGRNQALRHCTDSSVDDVRHCHAVHVTPCGRFAIGSDADSTEALTTDTTWQILWLYIRSLLLVSIRGGGAMMAMLFGAMEDTQTYSRCCQVFSSLDGVNLARFPMLSDQGAWLPSVC